MFHWPFIIKSEHKGKVIKASTITDGTIHTYWGDGQPVYTTEDDLYVPPDRWPTVGMPLFFPQITRTAGFRVFPGTELADKTVTANRYYYIADDVTATLVLNIRADHFFPPARSGINDFDGTNLSIYANGVRIFTPVPGQVPGQPDINFTRIIGDGLTPAFTPADAVSISTVQAWIEDRLQELLDGAVIDLGTVMLDGAFSPNPEAIIDFDVNGDFFSTTIGNTIRSQLGLDSTQSRITSRVYINSGDINIKWLNQVSPRLEDSGIENAFFGNEIQNIFVFSFFNYAGIDFLTRSYDPGTVLDDPFVQSLASNFSLFKSYNTDIWLDQGIADFASTIYADPAVPQDATDALELLLIDIANALSGFGFVYRGRFDSEDPDSVQMITNSILERWEI
jgi:hypothetical protein